MPKNFPQSLIKALKDDHHSGASEIVIKAANILCGSPDQKTIESVRSTHPDMAPLHNLCLLASNAKNPRQEIAKYLQSIAEAPRVIASKLNSKLPSRMVVMTYSRSSTVKASLLELHRLGKQIEVITPESRPGFEGRILSQELGQGGVETTLVTEAAALSKMESADYFIVGADRITPPIFVNKVGTLAFLIIAQHCHVPAILLADQSKFVASWTLPVDKKKHQVSEVCDEKKPGVHILNPYFEEVPLHMITWLITNDLNGKIADSF